MKLLPKSRWALVGIAATVITMLIILGRLQLLHPVETLTTTAAKPIQSFFQLTAGRVRNFFGYFQNVHRLQEENDQLKTQMMSCTTERLELQRKIDALNVAEQEMSFLTERNIQSTIGQVLARNPSGMPQTIVISRGERDHVRPGYPVIVGSGTLIGKIISTTKTTSSVLLLTDSHSEVSASVQNTSKSPGIVRGQYGISLKMELIPQTDTIEQNQFVTTSGLEEGIPSDLIIGKIRSITKKTGELFQVATIDPLVEYQAISTVAIILPPND